MVALVVGVATAIGGVLTVFVTAVAATVLGVLAAITAVLSVVSRAIVRILSLPFRTCIRNREPVSPLGTSNHGTC
jgi:hypothetical protein